jgi:hypothetical protein
MRTIPFPVTITNPEFGVKAEARITPDSESIVIITFTKPDGTEGIAAILVTAEIYPAFEFKKEFSVYPIFIPGSEVEITFNFHPNTIEGSNTIFAYITARSSIECPKTRPHGL